MELLSKVKDLRGTIIQGVIDKRVSEFKELGKSLNDELFKELFFYDLHAFLQVFYLGNFLIG